MTRVEFRRGLVYSLSVGSVGAGLSATAQYLNAPAWAFIVISVLAFPLIGVSVVLHVPVAVIAGYVFGLAGSVALSAAVLFLFFASVAFGQACVWFQVRDMRASSAACAATTTDRGDDAVLRR